MKIKRFPKRVLLVVLGIFAVTASVAYAEKYLVVTNEGEFVQEIGVSSWKPGEHFLYLSWAGGEGYNYPWQGEDSLDYIIDDTGLWVSGQLVGVNLMGVEPQETAKPEGIVTALLSGYDLAGIKDFSNLETVSFVGPIEDPGTDFEVFTRLPNLRGLFFAAGMLSEEQMAAISKCTELRELDLSVSILPEGAIDEIKELSNLRDLTLASVPDEELFALAGHKKLESITRFWAVTDTGWVDFLGSLPNLKELSIIQAAIAEEVFSFLAEANKLEALSLPYASEEAFLPYIGKMTNLKVCDLAGAYIPDEGLAHLANLTNLESLSVGGGAVTEQALPHIVKLTELKHLDISSMPLTDNALKQLKGLKNLRRLNLVSTDITDKGLQHLEVLKNLRYLDVSGTIVTDEGIGSLKKALPDCNIVHMY